MTGSICIWHCAQDRGAGRLIMEGESLEIVERTRDGNQQANYAAIGFGCTRSLRARLLRLEAQGIT